MNGFKHIVNRQVLEVTIRERTKSASIQNIISKVVRQKLSPALDSVFSKISGNGEIVRIDKLVIDLGTISEKELENGLVEKAVKEIEEKITRLLKVDIKSSPQVSVRGSYTTTLNDQVTITSMPEDALELFAFFLKTGRWPWWHISTATSKSLGSYPFDKIFAEVVKYESEDLKSALLPLLEEPEARQRIVFQLSISQLDALIKQMAGHQFEIYYNQFQVLQDSFGPAAFNTFKPYITEHFYKTVFKYMHKKLELSNEVRKVDFARDILNSVWDQFRRNKLEITEESLIELKTFKNKEYKGKVSGGDINRKAVFKSVELFIEKIKENSATFLETKKAGYPESMLKSNGKTGIKSSGNNVSLFAPKPSTDSENIIIYNAGIVLVHPFLRYFFEGLNLLDHDLNFKSQYNAFKAIHLLQYIVTGEEGAMENELMLNKILCGIDLTEPIPKSITLSAEEKEECVHLINTVLERWEALKTRNPAALRETYLQRTGILKPAGDSWNLTIERNTFDVMLEKLPWSVNLVRLPWNSQLIYVEW
jgi:hypothetical protein